MPDDSAISQPSPVAKIARPLNSSMTHFPDTLSYAPTHDLVIAGEHHVDGLGVSQVLLLQDAGRESVLVVVVEHRHNFLNQDGTVIQVLVHQVDGAAGHLRAVLNRLLLGLQPGK